MFSVVLAILAVWRVTHLLAAEDGPWDIFARLRDWGASHLDGKLVDCFYCLSLWIAAPLAFLLGSTRPKRLLLWPALSGGAILLERLTAERQQEKPLTYWEEEEDAHELLREQQDAFSPAGKTAD